jgi:hypothetical protein
MFGGGAGTAPFTGTRTGNTTEVVTYSGSAPTSGNCANYDSDGNLVDAGIKCIGTLFAETATVTVANTGTETTFIGSGVGSLTLPANFWTAGKSVFIRLFGIHSTTGSPTIEFKVKLGGTTLLDSGALTTATGATNQSVKLDVEITCYTTGVSGTVWAQGTYVEGGNLVFSMASTSASTIDTTASAALNITVQWGTASPSNTVKSTNVVIKAE